MLAFTEFTVADLDQVLGFTIREQLNMHEYSFISEINLLTKLKGKLQTSLSQQRDLSYVVRHNIKIVAFISCAEDSFDSEHLGIRSFRISELIVMCEDDSVIRDYTMFAIESLITKLKQHFGTGYLFASLSNNYPHLHDVFNSYCASGFNFIHTLLTFSQSKSASSQNHIVGKIASNEIKIREAKHEDLPYLEEIALTSFRYSRFHMDPLLNNDKASNLLKISAHNALAKGLADIIFVAEYKGVPVGYYSGKKRFDSDLNITIGEATISAVSSSARGKGVFRMLNAAMLDWFKQNTDVAEMGTYMINAPVHRTWISNNLPLIRGTHQFSRLF